MNNNLDNINNDLDNTNNNLDNSKLPDFNSFDPDQLVCYFKDAPETYTEKMFLFRDTYQISESEIEILRERFYHQLSLPHQSEDLMSCIKSIITDLAHLLNLYKMQEQYKEYETRS